ncbi:neopullulanase SusA [Thermaurantimonas aggregans]|uniref:Neopullulanase SusA n=1 Tax=Thermaurantimonas aggregans TaxID=2173829 RepID=A0A401XMB1_9FLAO|nr:alpha-amylase family glycosyl hydrolase [Thermaurantimonas aggregans]GCD78143.1 neopullulanase SusA [Thermaurantimonas aggregans]
MKTRFLSGFNDPLLNAGNFSVKFSRYFLIPLIFSVFNTGILVAQKKSSQLIERIDPPQWWSGMCWNTVEFLVKGKDLTNAMVELVSGSAVLKSVLSAKSSKYLYVTLEIPEIPENQEIKLRIKANKKSQILSIPIRPKTHKNFQTITSSDVIYLITPDRFANGNPANDHLKGFYQSSTNRNEPYDRHGGDIAGIASKIDYFKEIGVSALWISPVLENNQPHESYHGYAITDLYKIDPRMGTLEEYINLSASLQQNGIKLIKDMVFNHFGDKNYLFVDVPDSSWYHWWPNFTRTNYRATTLMDPYRSEFDHSVMTEGWFDTHMPDLNQKNPQLARYLIQNTLYWIEIAKLNGIRIDTYAYCDQDFMSSWIEAVKKDYPDLYIVAEIWEHTVPPQLFFDADLPQRRLANTHLDGITDFQLHFAIQEALNRQPGWAEGVNKLYYVLASDYLYKAPEKLVTFLDNHDVARIYGVLGKDLQKLKIALGWLLTLRGIPCIYYGTEILMAHTDGHGLIRQDFPGGWPDDTINKFTAKGRTPDENEAFNFINTLIRLRKKHPALATGKLTQYVPRNGIYFYTKSDAYNTFLIISNVNNKPMPFTPAEFFEFAELKYVYGDLVEWSGESENRQTLVLPPTSFTLFRIQ